LKLLFVYLISFTLRENIIVIVFNSNIVYGIIKKRIGIVSTNKNKRIMIIDDDKDITNLFSLFLEYNGYIVDAYTNPFEAFNNIRKKVTICLYLT
jgi:PleD family two-component response regulator